MSAPGMFEDVHHNRWCVASKMAAILNSAWFALTHGTPSAALNTKSKARIWSRNHNIVLLGLSGLNSELAHGVPFHNTPGRPYMAWLNGISVTTGRLICLKVKLFNC